MPDFSMSSLSGLCRLPHLAAGALWLLGCGAGHGEGEVVSDHLYVEGCIDGPFDLKPDFFASNPERDTQLITIKRGDRMVDLADGVAIAVYDVPALIEDHLGSPVEVILPVGITPPGHLPPGEEPGLVSLTVYLNDSCHEQDVSLQAITGTITFDALFSGDVSDRKKSERLIEGDFDVTVADPRNLPADGSDPDPAVLSQVRGNFSFYFRRGAAAQPFPGIE